MRNYQCQLNIQELFQEQVKKASEDYEDLKIENEFLSKKLDSTEAKLELALAEIEFMKRKKDPNAPKRPQTAFFIYSDKVSHNL